MWILGLKGLNSLKQFRMNYKRSALGQRGWQSTRLPRACSYPGVDAIIRWVEFVVGSLPCSERFFFGYSGFPLSLKPTFLNSMSIWNARTLFDEFLLLSTPWLSKLQ